MIYRTKYSRDDDDSIEIDEAPIIDDIPLIEEEEEEKEEEPIIEEEGEDPLSYLPQFTGGECIPDPQADNTDTRIALTFDAAVVKRAIDHDRAEQRAKVSFSNRTTNDYLSIYEEELKSCESRDWWDNITYPTGEIYL